MSDNPLLGLILVFAPLSILSFGGGQATIPEMQYQTVAVHNWLTNAQFADLFAIARASPGPSTLIVALIGWQVQGFLGAVVATVAVFLPSSLVMCGASAWWQRNHASPIRRAIERGLAPVAVGLIFAGAVTVLTAAHAGALTLITTAGVVLLLTFTRVSTYAMVGLISAVYLAIHALAPALAG